ARGHGFEAGDHAQERGFAASGRADQHAELAVLDLELDAFDRLKTVGVGFADVAKRDVSHINYFSVSIRPLTNRRCISTTTATGGSIASTAVAIATDHSVSASFTSMIFLMPMTMVCMSSRVVISSGQRY